MTVYFPPHDDGLFLRLAQSLEEGRWLGPYDNLTLAKGPAYPLFVSLAGAFGLPLKLAEHSVYLAAAAVLSRVAFSVSRRMGLALVLFTALAMNPLAWTIELARISRDALYVGLSLGVVAATAWLLLVRVPGRRGMGLWDVAGALLVGGTIAVYWLTREEGVWLAPSIGLIILGAVWLSLAGRSGPSLGHPEHPPGRAAIARLGAHLVAAAVGFWLVVGAVSLTNAQVYGIPLVNDLHGGNFPAAYGALARISHDAHDRYVVVPASARLKAYAVSPAAAELEPFLEGASGRMWASISCGAPVETLGGDDGRSTACSDIRAGWFMWALRDAISLAGHWGSAREAQDFQRRLANEINAACEKELACGPPRGSLAPPFEVDRVIEALGLLPNSVQVLSGADAEMSPGASVGDPAELLSVALRVGPISPPETPSRLLDGVTANPSLPIIELMQVVQATYAAVLPLMTPLAAVGILLAIILDDPRRRNRALIILATTTGVAFLARSALMAYLDVTSWPGAINNLYLAPGSPFLIVYTVIGGYLALISGRKLLDGSRKRMTFPDAASTSAGAPSRELAEAPITWPERPQAQEVGERR